MSLINAAGGLYYHARAIRYGKRWTPFIAGIQEWLDAWDCDAKGLVLVSPSAGYSLPTAWLQRLQHVVAIDVDPLARMVFSHKHQLPSLDWRQRDCFPFRSGRIDWSPLFEILDEHQDHAILFCNVLGQLGGLAQMEHEVDSLPKSLSDLRRRLQGRQWASYHDRFSCRCEPDMEGVPDGYVSDFALREAAYAWANPTGIEEHHTGVIGNGLPCHYFAWERVPGYWHVVEACTGVVVPSLVTA